MVWRAPRIWIDGPHITAAQMNQVSENLRQTAPAKAVAEGDLFYALGRNEIARLVLGPAGRFLVPGQTAPQWGLVPTPITSLGDMVVGNSSGEPSRVSAENGTRVGVMRGGSFSWEEEIFLEEWWTHSQWWRSDSAYDMTLGDGDEINQHVVIGRDLSISGTIVCNVSPVIFRFRNITLSSNATILCRPSIPLSEAIEGINSALIVNNGGNAFLPQSKGNGFGGTRLGGGGGGGGGTQNMNQVGGSGSNSSQSFDLQALKDINAGQIGISKAGNGADGLLLSASSTGTSGGLGGGVLLIAAKSVSGGSFRLNVDCSGEDGQQSNIAWFSIFYRGASGSGGGGGGGCIAVVADGISQISTSAVGGSGGSAGTADTGSGGSRTLSAGGDGGNGTAYLGTAFPS